MEIILNSNSNKHYLAFLGEPQTDGHCIHIIAQLLAV